MDQRLQHFINEQVVEEATIALLSIQLCGSGGLRLHLLEQVRPLQYPPGCTVGYNPALQLHLVGMYVTVQFGLFVKSIGHYCNSL